MQRTWLVWIALAACAAPAALPVENRVQAAPAATRPPGACPRLAHVDADVWQNSAFPQCPPEPFATELPICGDHACPRPCRVTKANHGVPASTVDVRYDSAGRWLAITPSTASADTELRREATYDGDRLQSCHSSNPYVDYTEKLVYDHGRLAQITHKQDGDVRLSYDGDRIVGVDRRTEASQFKYDASGRLVTILTDAKVSYRYDDRGLLVELVQEDLDESRYTYDARRRLVRVDSTLHQGDASGSVTTITYDSADRVLQIIYDETVDTVYRYTTTYGYCD